MKSQTWTSQDGQPRFSNEIIANSVIFLDRKNEGVGESDKGDEPW